MSRSRETDIRQAVPCPRCGCRSSRVLKTEATIAGTRRRRVCMACHGRFTTKELAVLAEAENLQESTGDGVQTAQNSKG